MTFPLVSILVVVVLLAAVVWPRWGVWARWRQGREAARRVRHEDALKHILKSEAGGRVASLDSLAGALQITTGVAAAVVAELEERELVTLGGGELRLRPSGREMGLHIVRAHRLWEAYLAEHTGVSEVEWHMRAEQAEHRLTPGEADELAARLGYPTHDPHGDAIPEPDGDLVAEAALSLNAVAPEEALLITHIEDEPETAYRQIVALGLHPGMKAFVIDKSPTRVRFWADGNEHILAPVVAEQVSVTRLPGSVAAELEGEESLSGLRLGGRTRVVGLSPACRGQERRRLLDLGFVPGTLVEVEMVSPAGDPTAYRVRGAVIALRCEQADYIRVRPEGVGAA